MEVYVMRKCFDVQYSGTNMTLLIRVHNVYLKRTKYIPMRNT